MERYRGRFFRSGELNGWVTKINALPTKIGSLSASNKKMKELAFALSAQGEGAAVAVDAANRMVQFAEDSHKVLTAVQMIGGAGIVLQTGVTLATQQGFTACAKFAAQGALSAAATGTAAALGNFALDKLGFTAQERQWIQVGLDAFQVFSFLKAARSKVVPGSQCFVAGTRVVTSINLDGTYATKNIEDVKEGDYVLSRDQYNESDDLSPHRVTQTFARTSDHVRVLTIRDANGNVETIRTTDEHPFYIVGLGWTTAGALTAGQRLNEADDSNDAVVVSSAREEHPQGVTVYNFTVQGDHTYFVEDGQGDATAIWVHNSCFRDDALAAWSKKLGKKLSDKFQVHHIVPENMSSAANLRSMLNSVGIDPNDVVNSVPLLPKYHQREIHGFNDDYIEVLEQRIGSKLAQGHSAVKAELEKIGEELFDNVFVL